MKCSNCNGDYRTRELKCPYCGTENLLGSLWVIEISQAERDLKRAKLEKGLRGWTIYDVNRIVSRISLVLFVIAIIGTIIIAGISIGDWGMQELYLISHKDGIQEAIETCYEQGDYMKMKSYMDEYELYNKEEYEKYSQLALHCSDYFWVQDLLSKIVQDRRSPKPSEMDSYESWTAGILKRSFDVYVWFYQMDERYKLDIAPENRELFQAWHDEMIALWVGTLCMTDEEIQEVISSDYYLVYDVAERLAQSIVARRYWETWNL